MLDFPRQFWEVYLFRIINCEMFLLHNYTKGHVCAISCTCH